MSRLIRQSVQKLEGYVPGEQLNEGDWVKLNTNECPYPPSPAVARQLASLDADALRRYPDPVSSPLRERIAQLHGCDAAQVFVGNGSDELLALATRAYVEDDGTIGYVTPSYSLYPVLASIRDVAVRPTPMGDNYAWRPPAGYATSLFLLANPNAPTGVLLPHDEVRAFCRDFPGVVIVDEAYVDFSERDCVDLTCELENTLVARTLSKSYSLAGIRLGYAIGPAALIAALDKIKDSYNVNALTQAVALAALSDPEHMRANVERIKTTRGRLATELEALGFTMTPSAANFLWVRPPRLSAAELFARLRQGKVLVRHFAGEGTGDHLRVTIGTDAEIDRLLAVLRDIFPG